MKQEFIIKNIMVSYKNLFVLAMLFVASQMKVTASQPQIKWIPDGQLATGRDLQGNGFGRSGGKEASASHLSRRQIHVPRSLTQRTHILYLSDRSVAEQRRLCW